MEHSQSETINVDFERSPINSPASSHTSLFELANAMSSTSKSHTITVARRTSSLPAARVDELCTSKRRRCDGTPEEPSRSSFVEQCPKPQRSLPCTFCTGCSHSHCIVCITEPPERVFGENWCWCETDMCLFKNWGMTKARFPQLVEAFGKMAFTPATPKISHEVKLDTPRFWRCNCRNHIIPRGEPGDVIINLDTKEKTVIPPREPRGFSLPTYRGRGGGRGGYLQSQVEKLEKKLESFDKKSEKKKKKKKKRKGKKSHHKKRRAMSSSDSSSSSSSSSDDSSSCSNTSSRTHKSGGRQKHHAKSSQMARDFYARRHGFDQQGSSTQGRGYGGDATRGRGVTRGGLRGDVGHSSQQNEYTDEYNQE